MTTIRELQKSINELAKSKGWYDGNAAVLDPTWLGARLALVHSEVSEALECVRNGDYAEYLSNEGKPEGLPTELADIVIRVLDLAESVGIDMQVAIERKHAFNVNRPIRHGSKKL